MANFHIVAGASEAPAHPVVRKITPADLKEALAKGFDDFWAMPSHLVFLGLIYPIVGVCLAEINFEEHLHAVAREADAAIAELQVRCRVERVAEHAVE